MATRQEIVTLMSYVLGDTNRQILVARGLEALPAETRMSALRGLQDLGWIGHSGVADFEESYSLTKDGRMVLSEQPVLDSMDSCARSHVEALRAVDGESNCAQKEALKKLIATECDMGNLDSALIHCYELKRIAERTRDPKMLGHALFHEGKVDMAQNRWDEALESLLGANERYVEAGESGGVAMANLAMGVIYANKGDLASAVRCFESSLSMARMIGDKDLGARAEANLANIYDLQGRFDDAEAAYQRCLSFFVDTGEAVGVAKVSNNLGVLNLLKEDYQTASGYFEKTVEVCRKIKNREVLEIALVNNGFCRAKTGDLATALECTDEAVAILKESNNLNLLALAYRNYGTIEMRNLRHEAAFGWFEKGIRAAEGSGVEDTLAACYYEYGSSLIAAMTDLRLAKRLMKKAASLFKDIGNTDKAMLIEKKLATA
jgi:tetratricopeptide (TPR) repeat protein